MPGETRQSARSRRICCSARLTFPVDFPGSWTRPVICGLELSPKSSICQRPQYSPPALSILLKPRLTDLALGRRRSRSRFPDQPSLKRHQQLPVRSPGSPGGLLDRHRRRYRGTIACSRTRPAWWRRSATGAGLLAAGCWYCTCSPMGVLHGASRPCTTLHSAAWSLDQNFLTRRLVCSRAIFS